MNLPLPKPTSVAETHWRHQLREAYSTAQDLLVALDLADLPTGNKCSPAFPIRVPKSFVARMEKGNPRDPLLRQVLPNPDESLVVDGYLQDPVGDMASKRGRGLLHKYHGRALLITTGACAVHCRYCFRQHFPYATEHTAGLQQREAIDYIAHDQSIQEVILSGGDPLMLPTQRLKELTHALAQIAHIKRLRIHTRLPIVLPGRITPNLLAWLEGLPWPAVMVVHANHGNEFDANVDRALKLLQRAGVRLLNQAVLLAGVNDSVDALSDLMERSFASGATPYYLHRLDKVQGAQRFIVDDLTAIDLVDQLRRRLSGYLVPRLVSEQAGAPYKIPLI